MPQVNGCVESKQSNLTHWGKPDQIGLVPPIWGGPPFRETPMEGSICLGKSEPPLFVIFHGLGPPFLSLFCLRKFDRHGTEFHFSSQTLGGGIRPCAMKNLSLNAEDFWFSRGGGSFPFFCLFPRKLEKLCSASLVFWWWGVFVCGFPFTLNQGLCPNRAPCHWRIT